MITRWTFKDGNKKFDFQTFPLAFRSMSNAWQRGIEGIDINKSQVPRRLITEMAKSFSILGPPNGKGERRTYSYSAARQMAMDQGWVDQDGNINGREFKRPRSRSQ
jgi:hypothetical protein